MLKIIIKFAIKSLFANKLRSFLAMLGIIIGVFSVIIMVALGNGVKQSILNDMNSMKSLITVRPNFGMMGGVRSNIAVLNLYDAEEILKKVDNINMISPGVSRSFQIKYMNKNTNSSVEGVADTIFDIYQNTIKSGKAFNSIDSEGTTRIAVIGEVLAEELFEKENPVNKFIKINGVSFKVIGVINKKGQKFGSPDESIYIPYRVAMKQMMGTDRLQTINIQVSEKADPLEVSEEIKKVLRKRHKLRFDQEDDFRVSTMDEFIKQTEDFTKSFQYLLAGIASISLFVGGIGIMNIMLVSVTERTKEIGIRKAIGARETDILKQFLIESIVMTTIGGIIGILIGYISCELIAWLSPLKPVISITSVIISLIFSMSVGIFFGFYPAKKASSLDPIEALRYE